jgi:D-ribose pyranase
MQEVGIVNRDIAAAISKQGHTDLLMVVDAGFSIPSEVEVIDISLGENKPMVLEVLLELKKFFSVEKIVMAKETKNVSPTLFANISKAFGDGVHVETVDHSTIREMSKNVKTVIRTGDFTAYGNVVLVSGAGNRWKVEKPA